MGGVEDRRVLHPQAGEGVDGEEPAVVQLGRRRAASRPARSAAGRAPPAACPRSVPGRDREAVVVVAQLAVDDLRASRRRPPSPAPGCGPCRRRTPSRCRRPPACALSRPCCSTSHHHGAAGRVGDAHVVGHQVEHQAEPVLVQRGDEPVEAGPAAARLVDVRVVDGVVAVVAALGRAQQRRGVGVGHPEVGQVAGHLGGVVQAEAGVHLQPVGGRRHLPAAVPPCRLGHWAGRCRTTSARGPRRSPSRRA